MLPTHRLEILLESISPDLRDIVLYQDRIRLAKHYIDLSRYDQAPWDDLRELIAASARFDPRLPR